MSGTIVEVISAMLAQEAILALVHGSGLLALLGISFGAIERLTIPHAARSVLQGLTFGIGAMITMMAPVHVGAGMSIDSRALIVGFVAAFGGWPAALVAGAVGVAYRLWLGGFGAVPGAAGIAAAALLGLGWRYFLRPKSRIKAWHLAVLGLVVSCSLLTGAMLGYASTWALISVIGPYMVTASVAASVLLGLFVDRELRQIVREAHWKTGALTDPLTALPNRRAFERGMASLRPDGSEAALLMIDLDRFKAVNDTYGHAAGDQVLREVSSVLRAHMRKHDLLSRMGGEELAVLLPETGAPRARQIANRLRRAIEALDVSWDGIAIPITASIGVVVADGALPASQMFAQADAALYAAKHGGRNRVVFSGELLLTPAMEMAGTVQPPRAA